MTEQMSVDRLLRHYEQGEHAALEALGRRLNDTEARLLAQAAAAPERLRGRLEDLAARLHAAKEETDKRAESFREELLSAEPSPDAFRARLVMLEMEHASRLRLAEEGLRLLGYELEEALLAARARVKEFCDEARAGLAHQVGPERLRLVEALAETSRRLAGDEEELRRLREGVPLAAARAAERVERLERELAALRAQGSEEAHARRALEAVVAATKLESEQAVKEAGERAEQAAAAAALEREGLRRGLMEAERTLEELRPALAASVEAAAAAASERDGLRLRLMEAERAFEEARLAAASSAEDAGQRRAVGAQLERAAAAAGAERDKVIEQAMVLRRELEKRGEALEDAKRRLASAEASEKAVRQEAEEAAGVLRKARFERSSLLERLAGAQEEARAAKAAQEASRVDMRSLAETARALAGRVKVLEEELGRAHKAHKPGSAGAPTANSPEALRIAALEAALEAQRSETRAWQRRLMEADAARDRALAETRTGWRAEKEGYEEGLAAKAREITLLRTQLEASERVWQETLARQDAARMQEIFKLRAEIQRLTWQLRDSQAKPGPDAAGPA